MASCANQVTPSGGAKDESPPQPLKFSPANGSVFFTSQEIVIEFDEYFQANDVFNQLVISPPLSTTPDVKVKGKKLIIRLSETLRDSTTYTINFGESIKDIKENNVLENFTYVFSTGSYIDSMQITGSVRDVLTGKNAEKIYVVLYPAGNDTLFRTTKPYYFAKTNTAGAFQINNIKEGLYTIYAIEDQNFNFYYDLPNERIAFTDSIIKIDSAVQPVQLFLFLENNTKQQLLSAKSYRFGLSQLAFATNADSVNITYAGNAKENIRLEKNATGDTIFFWHPDAYLTEHSFNIKYDSIDTLLTVQVKALPPDSNLRTIQNSFVSNALPASRGGDTSKLFTGWDLDKKVILFFANPLVEITPEMFQVTNDSTKESFQPQVFIDSLNSRILNIQFPWVQRTRYTITISEGATKDLYQLQNAAAVFFIETRKTEDYGNVKFNFSNTSTAQAILQFMKSDNTVINQKILNAGIETQLTYNYLLPGKYVFRVIKDANGNGKWDAGSLQQKKQPEQILYYPGEVTIKANWEQELKWVIE
jgi:uncharacterized protein (DUF2141 family)